MGRLRRGNYIYEKGREIAKYNLVDRCPIKGVVSKKLEKILTELMKEGVFDEIL